MSVKLYMQTSGAPVETFNTFDGKPIGQWVAHEDYLALRDALREALDGWEEWNTQFDGEPSPDRWKNRSRTLPGIAQAMADQWGTHA